MNGGALAIWPRQEGWLLLARWLLFLVAAATLRGSNVGFDVRETVFLLVFLGYLLVATVASLSGRLRSRAALYLTGLLDVAFAGAGAGLSGGSSSPLVFAPLFFASVAGLQTAFAPAALGYGLLGALALVALAAGPTLSDPAQALRALALAVPPTLLTLGFGPAVARGRAAAQDLPLADGERLASVVAALPFGNREGAAAALVAGLGALLPAEFVGLLLLEPDAGRGRLFTLADGRKLEHEVTRESARSGPLGAVLAAGAAQRLARGDQRLQASGLPDPYPRELRGFVGTPVPGPSGPIGVLFAANRRRGDFGETERLVLALAAQAAQAALGSVSTPQQLAEAVLALARAAELAHPPALGHGERTARIAVAIGRELQLAERDLEQLALGAALHDIGEVAVPEPIWSKPEAMLAPADRAQVQQHTRVGVRIVDAFNCSQAVLEAVYHHHERWDGRGYPNGLSGERIPLAARIIAVADQFEALTAGRPQRGPLEPREAIEEIVRASGAQFDPSIVQALLAAFRRHGESSFALQREAPEADPFAGRPGRGLRAA